MNYPTTAAAILASMGKAGARLDHMGACEAGAGNISVSIKQTPADLAEFFPNKATIELPVDVPGLAGWTFFVTGSGCRLREIGENPRANVSVIIVDQGGKTGTWLTAPEREYVKPTSEFNSHLGVHEDQAVRRGVPFQAVLHAQPPYLVSLSHIDELRSDAAFNRAIFRWEPETIVQVPEGIKVLDFMVPGGEELGENNVRALRDHQIVLWSKHGIMARSDVSPLSAVDKVEYVEAGAMYEYRNRTIGNAGAGLQSSELSRVIEAFGVQTTMFE